jgi:hypothetical protein
MCGRKRILKGCVEEEKNIPEYIKRGAPLKRLEQLSFYAKSVIIIKNDHGFRIRLTNLVSVLKHYFAWLKGESPDFSGTPGRDRYKS